MSKPRFPAAESAVSELLGSLRESWRAGSPVMNGLAIGLMVSALAVNFADPFLERAAVARWDTRVARNFVLAVRSTYVSLLSLALLVWMLPRSNRYLVLFAGLVAAALAGRAAVTWVEWFHS